jgi:hypothetical protein
MKSRINKDALVTRDSLKALLESENRLFVETVIGRALCVLLDRQTDSEQECAGTHTDNGVGFTGADAFSGTLTAKYFLKHKNLGGSWRADKWLKPNKKGYPRLCKYAGQLNEAAEMKMRAKAA